MLPGEQLHILAQNFLIIKYPTRPPLKVSLFDLNRLSVCLSVTLEAFLVDNFLPLVAGQCYIKAIFLCRPNSYRDAEKHAIAKYTEEKTQFLGMKRS